MSQASQIVAALDSTLRKVMPGSRKVYLRIVSLTGGDSLTGHGQKSTATSTLLDPQPYFSRLGHIQSPGMKKVHSSEMVGPSGKEFVADAWKFIVSPSAMSADTLANPDMTFVLADAGGNEETMALIDYETTSVFGSDLVYVCYMRSVERP